MCSRQQLKHGLRARGYDVTLPAGLRRANQLRIRRFRLPDAVAVTLHEPHRHAVVVPIDRMVNRAGFGYGSEGWHPYVAALEEHLGARPTSYGDTTLARFYERFQPRTVHDLLLHDEEPGALATWPAVDALIDVWTVSTKRLTEVQRGLSATNHLPHSQYRGPTTAEVGAMHLQRTVQVHRDIAATGYRPQDVPAGHVTGYFVTDGADYRFVVGHGNHRVAALAVLGYVDVSVRLRPQHPPVVSRNQLSRWTTSGGGLLTPAEASGVIDRLMGDGGRRRAVALGLR